MLHARVGRRQHSQGAAGRAGEAAGRYCQQPDCAQRRGLRGRPCRGHEEGRRAVGRRQESCY